MLKKAQALAQSPLGRIVAVAAGLGFVSWLVYKSGPQQVWEAVTRAPAYFIAVFVLEVVVSFTEAWAAVLLYGDARHKIPRREVFRVTLLCYSLIGVLPFGRAAGEASRAAMYAKYVGVPLAAASAARMQAISLLGNTFISIPCFIGVWLLMGRSLLLGGVALHFALTGGLGGGLILASRHSGLGARLGKLFRGGQTWAAVDEQLKAGVALGGPLAWVCASRVIRIGQRMTLLAAVGMAVGILPALGSESIDLVASMIGDLIPSQVGITEAGYALAATGLSMTQSQGIAMALLVHIAQIAWVGIGFMTPLFAPAPKTSTEPS